MPDKSSHDHHFVPVFYLKRWVVPPEKKLVEYAKRKHGPVTARWSGPKGTGYERFGYDSPDNSVPSLESTFFEPTDTQAAVAMESFFTTGDVTVWTTKPRRAWTDFMLTMLMRHPEDLKTFRRMLDADWVNLNDEMRDAYFRDRTPDQPDTAEEFWEQSRDISFETANFRMLRLLMRNSRIADIIDTMSWTTLKLHGAKHPLLTSDRPVLRGGDKLNEPDAFIMMH